MKKQTRKRSNDNRKEPGPMSIGAVAPRRKPTFEDVENAAKRTPVEEAASRVADLARQVDNLRGDIKRHEGYLNDFKGQLASAMLNHQTMTIALRDLTAIPQPVA